MDIGANIGIFSLFAVHSGAKLVIGYEPCSKSYEVCLKNIVENKLYNKINIYKAAVTHESGKSVKFPISSSVYNRIISEKSVIDAFEIVDTVSLENIIKDVLVFDLLKIDCEGGEYDIILNSKPEIYSKIREIKMEYHLGRLMDLTFHLENVGFIKKYPRSVNNSSLVGTVWYAKSK